MERDGETSFWDHLDALRRTLLLCLLTVALGTAIAVIYHRQLLDLFTHPLSTIGETGAQLVLLSPMEGIAAAFKVALWAGIVGTGPIWGALLLGFTAPALGRRERKGLVAFLLLSLAALLGASFLAYSLSLPMATQLLHAFNARIGLNLWSLNHYLNYAVLFVLGHGVAFELMVLLLFTIHYRGISPGALASKRPHMIIAILALSAILTPPDILSQCLLALPLLLFYEGTILYAWLRSRRAARAMSHTV